MSESVFYSVHQIELDYARGLVCDADFNILFSQYIDGHFSGCWNRAINKVALCEKDEEDYGGEKYQDLCNKAVWEELLLTNSEFAKSLNKCKVGNDENDILDITNIMKQMKLNFWNGLMKK